MLSSHYCGSIDLKKYLILIKFLKKYNYFSRVLQLFPSFPMILHVKIEKIISAHFNAIKIPIPDNASSLRYHLFESMSLGKNPQTSFV